MMNFTSGKYDCLVATMIIESGLDLPHVNTLLVNRADRFGLAQLYQLRGRVGRSEKRAYAYLFTPPFHFLTPEAVKRLRTIEEFTELGSGVQIAMRDLEIRGAGNLLGVEQSGNMEVVGYDLYMKLMEEAVHELKLESEGKVVTPRHELECQIDTDLEAIFPESYVSDESLRVNLYKRLASIQTVPQVDNFAIELKDRFGPLPQQAENLLEMARMKVLGQEKGFKRIIVRKNRLDLFFHDKRVQAFATQEQFAQYLRSMIDSIKIPFQFQQKKDFGLKLHIPETNSLSFSIKFLQSIG
jgi:transcription-repair coupling factor (superfamily II helicase)